jgi:hypothetical protein
MNLIELSSFLIVLGEAEICNFVSLILNENVGWLQIPVDD